MADLRHFDYRHLPPRLAVVSQEIAQVAALIDTELPDSDEKSAGLRKLLEAKDCFVRARIDQDAAPGEEDAGF